MLKSPSFITVGASHIESTARFFQAFGFVRESGAPVGAFAARELYGLKAPTTVLELIGEAGGRIEVRSGAGAGTTFTVTLPAGEGCA